MTHWLKIVMLCNAANMFDAAVKCEPHDDFSVLISICRHENKFYAENLKFQPSTQAVS